MHSPSLLDLYAWHIAFPIEIGIFGTSSDATLYFMKINRSFTGRLFSLTPLPGIHQLFNCPLQHRVRVFVCVCGGNDMSYY